MNLKKKKLIYETGESTLQSQLNKTKVSNFKTSPTLLITNLDQQTQKILAVPFELPHKKTHLKQKYVLRNLSRHFKSWKIFIRITQPLRLIKILLLARLSPRGGNRSHWSTWTYFMVCISLPDIFIKNVRLRLFQMSFQLNRPC